MGRPLTDQRIHRVIVVAIIVNAVQELVFREQHSLRRADRRLDALGVGRVEVEIGQIHHPEVAAGLLHGLPRDRDGIIKSLGIALFRAEDLGLLPQFHIAIHRLALRPDLLGQPA